jgi:acyl-coenzyme A synthetase/AMP-(fatty) acid ligase
MGLPTAAFRMILDAGIDPADLASLRSLATGASSLDPALRREFEACYFVPITQSYGATEFGGVVTLLTLADRETFGEAKADSVGRPLPGVRIRITDPETRAACAPGEVGRLEAIVPAMGDDWIATTDLAMLDTDGFLWHRGRLDGAIMRGGFKILPDQITQILLKHPAVAAAIVVGIADARLGHVPGALLQLRDGADVPAEADLRAYLRRHLPAIAVPERFRIVTALPRTPSLKIDLTQSRHMLETI